MWTVYKHTTPNGKVYIGITGQNITRRWQGGAGYYGNDHFHKAILKYGWDNIKHEILFENLSKEEAEKKEVELISCYDSTNPDKGYNKSIGGENCRTGATHSEETKKKYSEARKGRKHTEETKRKISKAMKGKKLTAPRKGHKVSEQTRHKISMANKGKKRTAECRKNARDNSKTRREVICIDTGQRFVSLEEAQEKTKIFAISISAVCKGKRKTAGGYKWRYAEERRDNICSVRA